MDKEPGFASVLGSLQEFQRDNPQLTAFASEMLAKSAVHFASSTEPLSVAAMAVTGAAASLLG